MKLKRLNTSEHVDVYEIVESEYKGVIWNIEEQGWNTHLYIGDGIDDRGGINEINPHFERLDHAMEVIELETGETFPEDFFTN